MEYIKSQRIHLKVWVQLAYQLATGRTTEESQFESQNGQKFSSPRRPDGLWGPTISYPMGTGDSFLGGKAVSTKLTTHLQLVPPTSRKHGSIHPLPRGVVLDDLSTGKALPLYLNIASQYKKSQGFDTVDTHVRSVSPLQTVGLRSWWRVHYKLRDNYRQLYRLCYS
jgi:hypothetical protein